MWFIKERVKSYKLALGQHVATKKNSHKKGLSTIFYIKNA
ncbi:hypothetical protein M23134_04921 [Microscilla marina ATCC 23134]|uniref:Uncharacterized protein n=1 Tax=Microscilla marina ATCC 23134 TaxID=313606 RepID=A1ZV91_MICM2|nr:hypothetical protein M23134_04921 [Microscilla marina ATCC 23134]